MNDILDEWFASEGLDQEDGDDGEEDKSVEIIEPESSAVPEEFIEKVNIFKGSACEYQEGI